jgi:hypothetical protein
MIFKEKCNVALEKNRVMVVHHFIVAISLLAGIYRPKRTYQLRTA